jgi:radical SAM/Cys-rich protein
MSLDSAARPIPTQLPIPNQFEQHLALSGNKALHRKNTEILQVNLGYMCNQTCKHCHVDAGPTRREIMPSDVVEAVLLALHKYPFDTLDLTGGAPEMHPQFRDIVSEARKTRVREIISRCNLTILLANKKYRDLPQFYADHQVRVVSSLPYFQAAKTDRQRGDGVFQKSIQALQMLNDAGYGQEHNRLILDLVYNPAGAFLPGPQPLLEAQFKSELKEKWGISFNKLLTITNMPIARFLEYLHASGNYEDYMEKLLSAFNPNTLEGVMCRNTLSVDWQGRLYDCDFNQMLGMKLHPDGPQHIRDFAPMMASGLPIKTGAHCFGCTAGSGSGCQGAVSA